MLISSDSAQAAARSGPYRWCSSSTRSPCWLGRSALAVRSSSCAACVSRGRNFRRCRWSLPVRSGCIMPPPTCRSSMTWRRSPSVRSPAGSRPTWLGACCEASRSKVERGRDRRADHRADVGNTLLCSSSGRGPGQSGCADGDPSGCRRYRGSHPCGISSGRPSTTSTGYRSITELTPRSRWPYWTATRCRPDRSTCHGCPATRLRRPRAPTWRDELIGLVNRLEDDHYLVRVGAHDRFATSLLRRAWLELRRLA